MVEQYLTPAQLRNRAFGIRIPKGEKVDEQLATLIAMAQRRLLNKVPNLPSRVASGAVDVELVGDALFGIVARVVRNPRGITSEQAGEFSYRLNQAIASGDLRVFPEDLEGLVPRKSTKKWGTIQLGVPGWRQPK